MTRDHDIERVLDQWFIEGPTQMPSRLLDDTLDRIDRAPQHRLARLQTRLPAMHPNLRFAAAAAVVLAAAGLGAGLIIRTGGTGGPLPAGSGTLPASLQAEWHPVGDHPLPFMHSGTEVLGWDIVIGPTSLTIFDRVDVHSTASLVGPDRFELRTLDLGSQYWHCHVGDAGTYEFRLSPGGQRLTLTPVNDACADRAAVLQGDWSRTDMSTRPVAVIGLTAAAFTPAPGSCNATAGSLRPDAWADLAGPRDEIATAASGDGELAAFFGGTRAADPAAWAAGDPFALAGHRAVAATDLPILLLQGGADGGAADARAFQAALVAGRHHSRLIEIASADHFGTTVAKESIEAIFALATAK